MKKAIVALLLVFASTAAVGAQTAKKREPHWESNLSLGPLKAKNVGDSGTTDPMAANHFAVVKSFWFYPMSLRVLAVGLSFDYVQDDLPLSANIALNLPTRSIVPFVSAGAGFSLSGGSLKNYGGGLKFRTGKCFGLIAEYRRYRISVKSDSGTQRTVRNANYFGAGIAYLY